MKDWKASDLPPAMTDAEKALIEACIAEMPEWSTGFGGTVSRIHSIYDLTQAVLAERAPPDPHAVLKEEVVQAAISLVKTAAVFGYDLPSCKIDVVDAVSALLAAQRPPIVKLEAEERG